MARLSRNVVDLHAICRRAGLTIAELEALARIKTNLQGMIRWRYVTLAANEGAVNSKRPRKDTIIRATPKGLMARELWPDLQADVQQRWNARMGSGDAQERYRKQIEAVESRWCARFSSAWVVQLRKSLEAIVLGANGLAFLTQATTPPANGWRARAGVRNWPWQPMVLHRGGYPDGS